MTVVALRVHLSLDRHNSRQSVQYYSDMVDTPQWDGLKPCNSRCICRRVWNTRLHFHAEILLKEMKEEQESHEQRHENSHERSCTLR